MIPCSSNNATADSICAYCDLIGKAMATSSITSFATMRGRSSIVPSHAAPVNSLPAKAGSLST